MPYVTAKRTLDVVQRVFTRHKYPLVVDRTIIPDDPSTLFVCSGMQRVRKKFSQPDGSHYGSLQSCIRTDDLELVGDGSHLTYFEMLGNFSFGGNDYADSVELWHGLLRELTVRVDHVNVHPSQSGHRQLWERRGYTVRDDSGCVWSDGEIGGFCCELYQGSLELGNLVNPLGHSTDVGFGWERLLQIVEGKSRVDQTSLFRQDVPPRVSDHIRTLQVLWENKISPGSKGRQYICRRMVRRILDEPLPPLVFDEWLQRERQLREQKLKLARRCYRRYRSRPPEFWWETYGILPEELPLLQ